MLVVSVYHNEILHENNNNNSNSTSPFVRQITSDFYSMSLKHNKVKVYFTGDQYRLTFRAIIGPYPRTKTKTLNCSFKRFCIFVLG